MFTNIWKQRNLVIKHSCLFIIIAYLVALSSCANNKQSKNAGRASAYPDSAQIADFYGKANQYYSAGNTDSFLATIRLIRSRCKMESQHPALMDYYKYQVIGNLVMTSRDSIAKLYVDSALLLAGKPYSSSSSYVGHYIAGLYYLMRKNYEKSGMHYTQSIRQQLNQKDRQIDSSIFLSCYANLAEIYFFQKNYKQAFAFYQPLFLYAIRQRDSARLLRAYDNMAIYKLSSGDTVHSVQYLNKAEEICNILGDTSSLVSVYGYYIYIYTTKKLFDSAAYYGEKVLPILAKKASDYSQSGQIYINLSLVYASLGQEQKASGLFDKGAVSFWDEPRNTDDSLTYYQALGVIRSMQKRYEKANEAKDSQIAITKRIRIAEKSEQLLDFEKAMKKAGAEKIIAAKDNQIERQRIRTTAMSIIALLSLVGALAIFLSLKRKKAIAILQWGNKQKETELQNERNIVKLQAQERERIAQEMHDDVGSTLSALNMAISSLEKDSDAPQVKMAGGFAQKLSVTMNEIIWDLNPMNDNVASLIAYLRRFSKAFLEQAGIALDFIAMNEEENVPVNGHTRRNIYLFTKELLNNIVKYAQATKVDVRLEIKKQHVVLHISDNGTGFDFSKQKFEGNGLRGIIKRVEDLNGFIDFDTEHGTTVVIRLPV